MYFLSNRHFGKLVGKGLYALQSIFSDRPTLDESFGINFSFVAYTTTYLYRVRLTHFPDVRELIGTLFFYRFSTKSDGIFGFF